MLCFLFVAFKIIREKISHRVTCSTPPRFGEHITISNAQIKVKVGILKYRMTKKKNMKGMNSFFSRAEFDVII